MREITLRQIHLGFLLNFVNESSRLREVLINNVYNPSKLYGASKGAILQFVQNCSTNNDLWRSARFINAVLMDWCHRSKFRSYQHI
jgi:hypothetical protein